MKIIYGKRKRNVLVVRFMILFFIIFAIFKVIKQRIKIMKLQEENERVTAMINN